MPFEPERLARLREQLAVESLDALLILTPVNLRYLCGFSGSAGVLLVTAQEAALFVDARYTEQAQKEVRGARALEAPRPVLAHALQSLPTPRRLGFEANNLTVAEYQDLQKLLPGCELVGLRGAVEALRAIKDESELARMKRAIAIADEVFAAFLGWCKPGMTENEVAARLEFEQRLLGGERNASGVTIVSSGPRTALPHGVASDKVILPNEPVMLDIGTVVGGYCSDLTRTVYFGRAPAEFRQLYETVYQAQQAALDGVRPGMTTAAADALARQVIEAAGHGARFGHALGHSLGLDVHERPHLHPLDPGVVRENMVFTCEPGVYLPGFAGVRIEDVMRITASGCELLSQAARTLVEL